jgi:hypothetical protein
MKGNIEMQKLSKTRKIQVPQVAPSAADDELVKFLSEHQEKVASYPWQLGRLLFEINGQSTETQFNSWREKFVSAHDQVLLPKSTAWDYLDRYRQAITAFSVDMTPEPVIQAMLAEGIPPNKQTVIDGARNSLEIQKELETIRTAVQQNQIQFIPGLCSAVVTRIRDVAKRKGGPGLSSEIRNADALCRRFKLLISETDPLFTEIYPEGRTETPKPEDVKAAKLALYHGCLMAFQRCGLFPKSDVSSDAAVKELQKVWLDSQRDIDQMIAEMLPDREV